MSVKLTRSQRATLQYIIALVDDQKTNASGSVWLRIRNVGGKRVLLALRNKGLVQLLNSDDTAIGTSFWADIIVTPEGRIAVS